MTSSVSLQLPPRDTPFGKLFLDSQFMHYPKWAPKSTNLAGQTAIITGASTGLGLEAGRQMLGFGLSRLIIAVRSPAKGESAAAGLRKRYPKARIDVWELEMESYKSVQAFAARVDTELTRIDTVILNAGMIGNTFQTSPETGHERTVQVNYLSTFLLAILLLPLLKKKAKARGNSQGSSAPAPTPHLTIVNSGVSLGSKHLWEDMRPLLPVFDDTARIAWDSVERYWSSKLLGQLFFVKLFPYVSSDDVVFNMVDPGYIRGTSLQREVSDRDYIIAFVVWLTKAITGRRLTVGGSTYVDAAVVRGKESHGCFIMDWEVRPFALFAYTDKGKENIDVLWKETLEEFKFANVEGILKSLKE
ncbi:hypothetical protein SCUCBS95973_004068 [Sporothrix curviconia]|uniref:Short-chain dehydrogenase/reductase family protein n=1 Tax=Sporothrix curviconia TaxID=1260050 RepID=A0ABP0BL46_9PEZI